MNVIQLPLVTPHSSLKDALQSMRVAQKSAIVTESGPHFVLFKVAEVFRGLADRVKQLVDLTCSHTVYKLSPKNVIEWTLNTANPFNTEKEYEDFLDSVGHMYALVNSTPTTATIVTRHEYLAADVSSGPKDCYCKGPRGHDYPPPAVSTGDVCIQCGYEIHCEY